jgi:GNAT superfamily N-acetyltransferase
MSIVLRPGTPMDAAVCGPICFEAFKAIDDEHNFPWDFPSAEVATGLLTMMLSNPGFYSVVVEKEGNVVGSNFLDERGPIAGVGPITVHPAAQNQTIGRRLMGAVLDRASERHAAGGQTAAIRLSQSFLVSVHKAGVRDPRDDIENERGAAGAQNSQATMCTRPARPTWRHAMLCAGGNTVTTVAANSTMRS